MRMDAWLEPQWLSESVAALDVLGLSMDSRSVQPGEVFVALAGGQQHGLKFARQAVAQGAVAILMEDYLVAPVLTVPVIRIPQLQRRLPKLAARFYGFPAEQMSVMAVTGTNGKTSTAHWMAEAWSLAGKPAGVLGTLGNGVWPHLESSTHTTVDVLRMQRWFRQMRDQGVRHVAMEASSHGLEQGRMDAVPIRWAVFTNLTRDHLDYHGSMDAYAAAKQRLFAQKELEAVWLNADDPYAAWMRRGIGASTQVFQYGQAADADLHLEQVHSGLDGMVLQLNGSFGGGTVPTRMLGRFNAYNLMAVLGCLLVQDTPWDQAVALISALHPVRGRMQTLRYPGKPLVVVDYAHTPDALAKVLQELRCCTQEKLICVVGCGGNRDSGKRAIMGNLASMLADQCWFTADNPRDEDPMLIVEQMVASVEAEVHVVLDRALAIAQAIAAASALDIVLIAGKGHETYQEIAGVRYPFDDVVVARASLESGLCA